MLRRNLLQNNLKNVTVEIGLALQYVRLSHGVNNRCGLSTKQKRWIGVLLHERGGHTFAARLRSMGP